MRKIKSGKNGLVSTKKANIAVDLSAPPSDINLNQVIEDLKVIYQRRILLEGAKKVY